MPRGDLALSPAPVLRAKMALTRARSLRWRLWPGQAAPGLRILFYHRVADEPDELAVSLRRFAAHMDLLADEGLHALDVEEAVARHAEGRGAGVIGLCFDDGYADVADHALPVLERHAFSATVFLPTGVIDGTAALSWYDHPPPMLSWEQIRAFDRAGTLRFGAHTVTHPNLTAIDDNAAGRIVRRPRATPCCGGWVQTGDFVRARGQHARNRSVRAAAAPGRATRRFARLPREGRGWPRRSGAVARGLPSLAVRSGYGCRFLDPAPRVQPRRSREWRGSCRG